MYRRIAWARKERNIKQDDLAESCGITKNFISLIENGKREPSDRTIKDICRILNVNEEWLRTGEGEPFIPPTIDEELSAFVGELIADQSESFKKRLISSLTKLRPEQWDLLEEIIDTVNDMKKE